MLPFITLLIAFLPLELVYCVCCRQRLNNWCIEYEQEYHRQLGERTREELQRLEAEEEEEEVEQEREARENNWWVEF
jgi:hypothetical protein